MTHEEAVALLRGQVSLGSVWCDAGAGSGRFTRALAELAGTEGEVYAVEREPAALRTLRQLAASARTAGALARITPVEGDFTGPIELPALDGVLAANALHFVPSDLQVDCLQQLAGWLRSDGRLVIVEYDRERGNRWVPYPLSRARVPALAQAAGFTPPRFVARMDSAFGGEMYCAVLERNAGRPHRGAPPP